MENVLKEIGLDHLRVSYLMMEFAKYLEMDEENQKKVLLQEVFMMLESILSIKKYLANHRNFHHMRRNILRHMLIFGMDHEERRAICELRESYNGSGYPYQYKSDEISFIGWMRRGTSIHSSFYAFAKPIA